MKNKIKKTEDVLFLEGYKYAMKFRRTKTTYKQFKEFLSKECWDEKDYGDGKYDRKIWLWFFHNLY